MLYTAITFGLVVAASAGATKEQGSTCHAVKSAYQASSCCSSNLGAVTAYDIAPTKQKDVLKKAAGVNVCAGKKPTGPAWDNWNCTVGDVVQAIEQSGANVTKGYNGQLDTTHTPIMTPYMNAGLCPVNVHWHLGAEHYSVGEYDETGSGSKYDHNAMSGDGGYARRRELEDVRAGRRSMASVRQGFQCHHYNEYDTRFTTEYDWKYCTDTHVGETYEVHWPHSAAGMCGTPNQWQSPFYDGVFCNDAAVAQVLAGNIATSAAIGVQGQIFTIINDEDYYYPDLMRGMIIEGNMGTDIAYYTGSTTGQSRDNKICSKYGPITWQVDRKCHLISASSFDKMCKDMLSQRDDMSMDIHPHGARELVAHHLAADNQVRA